MDETLNDLFAMVQNLKRSLQYDLNNKIQSVKEMIEALNIAKIPSGSDEALEKIGKDLPINSDDEFIEFEVQLKGDVEKKKFFGKHQLL